MSERTFTLAEVRGWLQDEHTPARLYQAADEIENGWCGLVAWCDREAAKRAEQNKPPRPSPELLSGYRWKGNCVELTGECRRPTQGDLCVTKDLSGIIRSSGGHQVACNRWIVRVVPEPAERKPSPNVVAACERLGVEIVKLAPFKKGDTILTPGSINPVDGDVYATINSIGVWIATHESVPSCLYWHVRPKAAPAKPAPEAVRDVRVLDDRIARVQKERTKCFVSEAVARNDAVRLVRRVAGEGRCAMSDKAVWMPAAKPPSKDDWVVVSACGMVRCVAWNNAVKQWQDWGNTGIILDEIEWWMSIPDTPEKPKSKADDGSAAAEIERLRADKARLREALDRNVRALGCAFRNSTLRDMEETLAEGRSALEATR